MWEYDLQKLHVRWITHERLCWTQNLQEQKSKKKKHKNIDGEKDREKKEIFLYYY